MFKGVIKKIEMNLLNKIKNITSNYHIQFVLKMNNNNIININNNNKFINITFKKVFTTNTQEYCVSPYWTLEELYTNIGIKSSIDFEINENELELIDTCNSYIIFTGRPVETYPALPKSSDIQLKDLWGIDMKYLSMYIRKKNSEISEQGQCMVCLEDNVLEPYYQCGHKMCCRCYASCLFYNRTFCPMCRNENPI